MFQRGKVAPGYSLAGPAVDPPRSSSQIGRGAPAPGLSLVDPLEGACRCAVAKWGLRDIYQRRGLSALNAETSTWSLRKPLACGQESPCMPMTCPIYSWAFRRRRPSASCRRRTHGLRPGLPTAVFSQEGQGPETAHIDLANLAGQQGSVILGANLPDHLGTSLSGLEVGGDGSPAVPDRGTGRRVEPAFRSSSTGSGSVRLVPAAHISGAAASSSSDPPAEPDAVATSAEATSYASRRTSGQAVRVPWPKPSVPLGAEGRCRTTLTVPPCPRTAGTSEVMSLSVV